MKKEKGGSRAVDEKGSGKELKEIACMKGERTAEEGRKDVYGEKIRKRIRATGDVKRRMREVENEIQNRTREGARDGAN